MVGGCSSTTYIRLRSVLTTAFSHVRTNNADSLGLRHWSDNRTAIMGITASVESARVWSDYMVIFCEAETAPIFRNLFPWCDLQIISVEDRDVWSMGKVAAYKSLGDNFVHLDMDTFTTPEIRLYVERKGFTVQGLEGVDTLKSTYFTWMRKVNKIHPFFPDAKGLTVAPTMSVFSSIDMGDHVREYCKLAEGIAKAVYTLHPQDKDVRGCYAIIAEQLALTEHLRRHGMIDSQLFALHNYGDKIFDGSKGFTHYWTSKRMAKRADTIQNNSINAFPKQVKRNLELLSSGLLEGGGW